MHAVAEWLEALVRGKDGDKAVQASMAAIQTAALIPREKRTSEDLGRIVLTAECGWRTPDPQHVFLSGESLLGSGAAAPSSCVHPKLASDRDTLQALKSLGLEPPSPESGFRLIAERILQSSGGQEPSDDLHRKF